MSFHDDVIPEPVEFTRPDELVSEVLGVIARLTPVQRAAFELHLRALFPESSPHDPTDFALDP